VVNDLRIYYGGRGIWWNKEQTSSIASPGVAVGLLHNGSSYADELTTSGVVYHYPVTASTGTDSNEIDATKNAGRLRLPIFIISQNVSRRSCSLRVVRDWDDGQEVLPHRLPPTSRCSARDASCNRSRFAVRLRATATSADCHEASARPGDVRVSGQPAIGPQCAACDLRLSAIIDAAHIVDVQHRGSMSSGNGLPLCPTHHRMWDQHLFGIRPGGLSPEPAACFEVGELQLTRTTLAHLGSRPSAEAIEWRWENFRKANQGESAAQPPAPNN